jgi:hypothetical protein
VWETAVILCPGCDFQPREPGGYNQDLGVNKIYTEIALKLQSN